MLYKDKISFLLVLIPILIGVLLYVCLGQFFFSSLIGYGQTYIEEHLSNGTFGKAIYFLLVGILTVTLYFIVNWTFVLVLSILASPFNDLLSERIEKNYYGENTPSIGESLNGFFSKMVHTILNEIKKVFFILILSVVAFLLGYFPIFTPISILITIILLGINYIDYSWARHDILFKDCKKDIRKNLLSYALGGGIFMLIVSIPVINIIVPSLATSYFTILWIKNNEHSHKTTK